MIKMTLLLHIAAGLTALVAAGAALGTEKGARWHRRAGTAYALAMLTVTLTVFVLVSARPNVFLLVIGLFNFYLVFTGWRAAVLREGRLQWIDHLVGGAMALTGAGMLGLGALGLAGTGGAQPIILLIFGSIGLTMALSDWHVSRAGPLKGTARISRHLTRMLAGTIGTITAATVVNLDFLPSLVTWLGPTAALTPVIFWWNRRILRGTARA